VPAAHSVPHPNPFGDAQLVTSCVSLVYGYLLGAPAALYLAAKYFLKVPSLGFMQLTCLVGYSLFLYVPCAILATFSVFSWPALAAACAASSLFLLRSLKPVLGASDKAPTALLVLALLQVGFFLVVKLRFYSHKNTIST
jgi:hypothetical protein